MMNFIKQLLDWIYYRNCYICKKICNSGLVCQKCLEKIELNFAEPSRIINEISVYTASNYDGILKKIIRGLKFHNKKELSQDLAYILYSCWKKFEINKDFEIVPIPLFPKKEKKRGFNHMYLTAVEFSKFTGYRINNELIKRIKDTKPQYNLSRIDKINNLKGAFEVYPEKYNGKTILLLDDICTTGTTLEEAIKTLQQNGITDIVALVASSPN